MNKIGMSPKAREEWIEKNRVWISFDAVVFTIKVVAIWAALVVK